MTRRQVIAGLSALLLSGRQAWSKKIEDFDYRSIAKRLEIKEIKKGPGTLIATLSPNEWRSELTLCRNYDLWMDEMVGKNAVQKYNSVITEKGTTESPLYIFISGPDGNEKLRFSNKQYNKIHKELVNRKLIKTTDKVRIGFDNHYPLKYAQHDQFYNIIFTYGAVVYEII